MKTFYRILALLTCAGAVSICSATAVSVTFDNQLFNGSGSDNVEIKFPKLNNAKKSTTLEVNAGRFQGNASKNGMPDTIFVDGLNNLYMYCYDLYDGVHPGKVVNYTINLNGELARTLDFLGAVNSVMNPGKNDPFAWLHPMTGSQGAAIQLGIWESKYDISNWDLNEGDFSAEDFSKDTKDWWNKFKQAIGTTTALDGKYVMTLESDDSQDMITASTPAGVPEPGSLALIGAGLAGLAFVRRKKLL